MDAATKESIVKRLLTGGESVEKVADELGLSKSNLFRWKRDATAGSAPSPAAPPSKSTAKPAKRKSGTVAKPSVTAAPPGGKVKAALLKAAAGEPRSGRNGGAPSESAFEKQLLAMVIEIGLSRADDLFSRVRTKILALAT